MPRLIIILVLIVVSVITHGASLPAFSLLGIIPFKTSYTIAVYGDSMVDTMGEQLDYLQTAMKKRHPHTTIYYYNYGIGSQNVEEGLSRFHQSFDYKDRHYPSISSLHPDIIVIGSFAYNPFYPYDRDKHWNTLIKLVQEAKNTGASVYMLAEIAPLKTGFGKGPNGVSWQDSALSEQAQKITELLENSVYLAQDHLKVPLINAYSASTVDGKFGKRSYVDTNDGIHPSVAGHQFMAEMIAKTLKF